MRNVTIVSMTYSLQISDKEVNKLCMNLFIEEKGLANLMIQESNGRILNVEYGIDKPNILITVKTNSVVRDPDLWNFIEKFINAHL